MNKTDRQTTFLLIGAGLIAVVLQLYATSCGILLTNDSGQYLHAAATLLSEGKLLMISGDPYVAWPPGLPFVLAGIKLIDPNIVDFARFFQAVVLGLTVFIWGKTAAGYLKNRVILILFLTITAFSVQLLIGSVFLWSENVFNLLAALLFWNLIRYKNYPNNYRLMLLILIGAGLCMQRFAGLFFISGVAASVLIINKRRFGKAFIKSGLFFIATATPVIVWRIGILSKYSPVKQLDDFIQKGMFSAGSDWTTGSFSDMLYNFTDFLSTWLLPHQLPYWIRLSAVIVIGCVFFFLIFRYAGEVKTALLPALIVYFIFIFRLYHIQSADSERFISPLYIPAVLLFAVGYHEFLKRMKQRRRILLLLVPAFIWTLYPVVRTVKNIHDWKTGQCFTSDSHK